VREQLPRPGAAAPRWSRRQALRSLAGAVLLGGAGLAGCGRVVPGAYTGPGSAVLDLARATPSHPASMFSVDRSTGTYALVARGGGLDVGPGGADDDFSYYFAEVQGDGDWSCLVVSQQPSPADGGLAFAGIMARASPAADAANVAVLVTDGNGVAFAWRPVAGQPEEQYPEPIAIGVGAPIWVRLRRRGATWNVWYSLDGHTWDNQTSTTVVFPPGPYLVGLAASSHDPARQTVDVFRDLRGFRPNEYLSVAPEAGSASS
jgi:hypothetical protein